MASLDTTAALAARAARDIVDALRFFSRLPLPRAASGEFEFQRFAWASPIAGALIGALGGLAGAIGVWLWLPASLRGLLAIATTVLATGALHEDGLADVADGFGGGKTREQKLQIMRDSRIGTYGVVALILTLSLRIFAAVAFFGAGAGPGFGALVVAGAAARFAALAPLALLKPARSDGAGAGVGQLTSEPLIVAGGALAIIAFIFGLAWLGVMRALFACVVAGAAAWAVTKLAQRQIGGQTGDVAGAAATIGEAAAFVGLLMGGPGA